jgi:4-amino-4-deoxy-L-arabinose transferase-like glycosyltransferase
VRLSRSATAIAVLLGVGAFAVRAVGLTRSFELWVDEMVYTQLGDSVAQGQLPNLFGHPFFLHPPGAFLIEGLVIKVCAISGDDMTQVFALRWIDAVLGAVTVAIAYLLVRRVSSTGIAVTCAAILALDPFVLRNNSRVFLETPATVFVLAGYLVLVRAMQRTDDGDIPLRALIPAGLLLGCGVLTKDAMAVLAVLPIVLAVLWRRTLRLRQGLVLVGSAAAPYVAYLVLVGVLTLLGTWYQSKLSGVERMIGLKQTTGFNAPNAPSLVSRLIAQIGQFGTSYVLLIACPVAGVIAALSTHRTRRLLGLCAVAMGAFGLYAALFGTFEEQYGYGVMVGGTLAIGAAAADLMERRGRRTGVTLRIMAIVLVVASAALAVRAEVTPDNGVQRLRAWVAANLPANSRVGVTNSTAQWAFGSDPRFGIWPSAPSMQAHHANYIVTQSLPTSEGYGYARPDILDWLKADGKPLFRFSGPTGGDTVLWYVDPQQLAIAARLGIGSH